MARNPANTPDTTPASTPATLDDIAASLLVPNDDNQKRPKTGASPRGAGRPPASDAPQSDVATTPSDELAKERRPGGQQSADQGDVTDIDAEGVDDDLPLDDDTTSSTTDGASDTDDDDQPERSPLDLTDDELFGDTPDDTDRSPDDDGDGDAIDTSRLTDDVKLSVTVDGEDREVTLGDLKKRYAGEGAIEKRLQEATETRKLALKQYNDGRSLIETTLKVVGETILTRTVPQPDPALRASNPQEYLLQKDAYDQETQVLAQRAAFIQNTVKQAEGHAEQVHLEAKRDAAVKLRQALPILNDTKRGPLVRAAIAEAAEFLGFSSEDLASSADHRHFLALYNVAKLMRLQRSRTQEAKGKAAGSTVSTLPSKGARPNAKGAAHARQQQAATKRASETGSVDDIAATLLMPAPKQRRAR